MREIKLNMRHQVKRMLPEAQDIARQSAMICGHLARWERLTEAQGIAAYMPLPAEADIRPVLELILARSQRLYLPRCRTDGGLDFCRVRSLNALIRGKWGLLEPAGAAADPDEIDLYLLPLEGLDRSGHRLGKGGGCYDRSLMNTGGFRTGIALSHQWVAHVPCEPWDLPLDAAADPDGIIIFKAGGNP